MRLVGAPAGRKRRSHSRDRPRYPRAASTDGVRTHVRSLVITVGRALQRRAGTRQTKVVVIKCGRVSLLGIDTSSPSS